MALEPITLDGLDWAALTDAARRRIPALSGGRWTHHAPVDPGITLIELFAWLLDQRVYWLDRVPEPLFRAGVELLGEGLLPTQVARTVVRLECEPPATFASSGATLEIARAESSPVFAVSRGIELLPIPATGSTLELRVAGKEHSNDLSEGRGVTLFRSDGGVGAFEIALRLSKAPTMAARPFSLFFELETSPEVRPAWDREAAEVAPAAEIRWWYSCGPGVAPRPFPVDEVEDGTAGLRRSGLVRLPIMPDWAPSGPALGPLVPYAIFARTEAATFTHPVRVRRIVPNAALAAHRHTEQQSAHATDWLPLPGLEIALEDRCRPPIARAVRVRVLERDGVWHSYRPVSDFARTGPSDRVFRVDRLRGVLSFGDGLNGRIPRPDPAHNPNLRIRVAVGGGSVGNVSAGVALSGVNVPDARATTLVPALGGQDAETVSEARTRIGGLLARVERAVTARDHVVLSESTPGVAIARAHAAVGYHPAHPCTVVPGALTVFVVPWAPRGDHVAAEDFVAAPSPDRGALAAVRARLESARMVGSELCVQPPRYRTIRLALSIVGDASLVNALRERIEQVLRRFLDPLEGGDEHRGWPFGEALRPSALMREVVFAVEDAEVTSVAIGIDGAAPTEDCDEVPLGPHDLPALLDVDVRFERDGSSRPGGLR